MFNIFFLQDCNNILNDYYIINGVEIENFSFY